MKKALIKSKNSQLKRKEKTKDKDLSDIDYRKEGSMVEKLF